MARETRHENQAEHRRLKALVKKRTMLNVIRFLDNVRESLKSESTPGGGVMAAIKQLEYSLHLSFKLRIRLKEKLFTAKIFSHGSG